MLQAEARAVGDAHRRRSSLESLFCYDKPIPEERIEEPVGVSLAEKLVGDNPRCTDCQAKGAVLCTTCSGSGLYVDSILESQGIIVKVRCLVLLGEMDYVFTLAKQTVRFILKLMHRVDWTALSINTVIEVSVLSLFVQS
ncbi:hypothetical protein Golob_001379 [Gossypium lobatum]|uniref:Uncharacterized protein n=1 Tax=Gossypium lobatum TaxID=34289 RepID=A0A7J8NAU4_9ROSI|nr:hypothetical protein [Gossypium lobatum]